jgi:hypothetical protein
MKVEKPAADVRPDPGRAGPAVKAILYLGLTLLVIAGLALIAISYAEAVGR